MLTFDRWVVFVDEVALNELDRQRGFADACAWKNVSTARSTRDSSWID